MKRSSNNNENSFNIVRITQWVIPTVILFVYVLVTLYSFSANLKSDSRYSVRQKIADYNDSLVISLDAKIEVAESVVDAVSKVASYEMSKGTSSEEIAKLVLATTIDDAYCSRAYIVDKSGNGYSDTGETASVERDEFFSKCVSEKKSICSSPVVNDGEQFMNIYGPVMDDGGSVNGVLIYRFDFEVFKDIPSTTKYDGRTGYMVIDSEGEVISAVGRGVIEAGDNIFESDSFKLKDGTDGRVKNNFTNRNAGYVACTVGDEGRQMSYAPCTHSDILIATLVTESYISGEVETSYRPIESILIRVLIAMIAFFAVLLGINLANRAVNNKHNQSLQEKAETDLLTGLLNKMSTEQKVTDYLVEASAKGETAILFLIDIDNFKKVNDTMGHAFGDELLAGLGDGLSALYRATDIVGRIGGDEFLVLMKNIPSNEETKKREADKLLDFFRQFKVGEYVQYKCTASIGGAVFSQDGGDFDELYKAADNAMYESKRHGKNRIAFYGETLEGPVIDLARH